jgi:hypothetical protein
MTQQHQLKVRLHSIIPVRRATNEIIFVSSDVLTDEFKRLASKPLTILVAESNGHVTQASLPLPAAPETKTEPIIITIPGQPIGKPRMTTADKWQKNPRVLRYWAWCDRARLAAGDLLFGKDIEWAIIHAFFSMPLSWSNSKKLQMDGQKHFATPDYDNVAKGVCDALIENDEIIADALVQKRWTLGEPKVVAIFGKGKLCLDYFLN